MMKKYGVKYPHQANKCFCEVAADEHCDGRAALKQFTQPIIMHVETHTFSKKIFKFSLWETALQRAFLMIVLLFRGLGGFAVLRAKSLDIRPHQVRHRPKKPSSP